MAAVLAATLLAAACGRSDPAPDPVSGGAGQALEEAARARGLVRDPGSVQPVGVFASDEDRVCVRPRGGGFVIGASTDLGEGQRCVARGEASGSATLDVRFGDGCRFDAEVDGDRIAFPASLPNGCARFCEGRASLAALTAERLSDSAAEAARTLASDGRPLCGD